MPDGWMVATPGKHGTVRYGVWQTEPEADGFARRWFVLGVTATVELWADGELVAQSK